MILDVVLVPFPFTDSVQAKRGPALILSSHLHFNRHVKSSVMAMITSKTHSHWPLDVEIINLKVAGLPVSSIVRMKFFTLDHKLILNKLGNLVIDDQNSVSKSLKKLFPLQ